MRFKLFECKNQRMKDIQIRTIPYIKRGNYLTGFISFRNRLIVAWTSKCNFLDLLKNQLLHSIGEYFTFLLYPDSSTINKLIVGSENDPNMAIN